MTEKSDQIAAGLAEAIKAETNGYHFYMMAASSTSDEQGREVFTQLAQEELSHLQFLKRQHEALTTTGKIDKTISLGKAVDRSGESPIFSPALKERSREAHFEMSALSIGITLELNAVKHYKAQAEVSDDKDVTAFFNELVEWESGHYDALNRQLEELKEDYWAGGGFSPF
jgi:rubrerythrin